MLVTGGDDVACTDHVGLIVAVPITPNTGFGGRMEDEIATCSSLNDRIPVGYIRLDLMGTKIVNLWIKISAEADNVDIRFYELSD